MNDCIEWQGPRDRKGYGVHHFEGKNHRAHRLAWTQEYGPIPSGLWVLHACDNPACINLDHLFLARPILNVYDCVAKERQARGDSNAKSRLSSRGVQVIREMYASNHHTYKSIAEYLSCNVDLVGAVIRGKTYVHV